MRDWIIGQTHSYAFEVDDCFTCVLGENGVSKLRDIVASIALTSNKEVTVFVLGKSLEPIHEESIRILSCVIVAGITVVRRGI